jgi:hypothetical protein
LVILVTGTGIFGNRRVLARYLGIVEGKVFVSLLLEMCILWKLMKEMNVLHIFYERALSKIWGGVVGSVTGNQGHNFWWKYYTRSGRFSCISDLVTPL